jgi:hypothetical protein
MVSSVFAESTGYIKSEIAPSSEALPLTEQTINGLSIELRTPERNSTTISTRNPTSVSSTLQPKEVNSDEAH